MENIRQHYLPRCYLKNFAIDQRGLWTYNKRMSKKFMQRIENAGQFKHYYTVPEQFLKTDPEPLHPNFIETQLFANYLEPQMEALITGILRKSVNWIAGSSSADILNISEQQLLAGLLGIQFLRMPQIREKYWKRLLDTSTARLEIIKDFVLHNQAVDPGFRDKIRIHYDEAGKSLIHASLFTNQVLIDQFQDAILDKHWVFYVTPEGGLYTSDRPMIVKPHLNGQQNTLEGFTMYGAEIMFPLSPTVLLTLWDKNYFNEKVAIHNTFQPLPKENGMHYNIAQYCLATEEIYTIGDNFNLIEELKSVNDGQEVYRSIKDRP